MDRPGKSVRDIFLLADQIKEHLAGVCGVAVTRVSAERLNNRRLLKLNGNIPPIEAEGKYDAMLDERLMAAWLKPNSLRQT